MASASIETTLELWASSLRDVKARMRGLFTQSRVAASAGQFLDGLLGDERRKTGWMRAEAAGDPGPWRQQALLGQAHAGMAAGRQARIDGVADDQADADGQRQISTSRRLCGAVGGNLPQRLLKNLHRCV